MRRSNSGIFIAMAPVLALLTGDPLAAQSSLELRGGTTVESPHFFVGGLDYVRHVTGPLYISVGLATSARTATGLRTVVEIDEGVALGRQAAESRYLEIPLGLRGEFGGERRRARVGVAAVPGIRVECRYSMELYILDPLGRITGESRTPEVNCSERNIESDFTVFGRLEAGVQVAGPGRALPGRLVDIQGDSRMVRPWHSSVVATCGSPSAGLSSSTAPASGSSGGSGWGFSGATGKGSPHSSRSSPDG